MWLKKRNQRLSGSEFFEYNNFDLGLGRGLMLVRGCTLGSLVRAFDAAFFGLSCGYFLRFGVIGYNYRLKTSFLQSYMLLFVGHFFSILVNVKKNSQK